MPGTVLSTIHAFSNFHGSSMRLNFKKKIAYPESPGTSVKPESDFRVHDLNYYNCPFSLNIFSPFLLLREERNFPTMCHIYKLEIVKDLYFEGSTFPLSEKYFTSFFFFFFLIVLKLRWAKYGLWNQADLDLNPSSAIYYLHDLKFILNPVFPVCKDIKYDKLRLICSESAIIVVVKYL